MKRHYCLRSFGGLRGLVVVAVLLGSIGICWAQDKQPDGQSQVTAPAKDESGESPVVPDRSCELSPAEQLLVTELRQALSDLKSRQLILVSKEAALQALRKQIEKDMVKLRNLQKEITNELSRQDQKIKDDREKRIAQLANLLRKMRPENAANIIAATEEKLAIATLDRLGERQASKLLEALPPKQAADLAKKLLTLPFQEKEKK